MKRASRTFKSWFLPVALAVGGLALFAHVLFAQVPGAGTIIPDPEDISYFDGVFPKVKKLDVTGKEARLDKTGKLMQFKEFKAKSYRLLADHTTNELELIVEAPDCLFDPSSKQANSPGPMKVYSGDNRVLIEGVGFLVQQGSNNVVVTVSNQVSTTIKGAMLARPLASPTNTESSHVIVIHSDHLAFDHNSFLITYTGNVRASDGQTDLTCDVLTIRLTTNNAIQNVVADRNVVITSLASGGHVTGAQATYETAAGNNFLTITGEPRWEDGPREGTATQFIFNGIDNTFRAEGDAHFKLPRNSFTNSDFSLMPLPATPTNATGNVTNLVDLFADTITVQLPPTNGPIQGMIAERNVVILDPGNTNRATGDRATYSATTGQLQLTGNASLEGSSRAARAELLEFDRVHQAFAARSNAFLRMPVASLAKSLSESGTNASRTNATNLFLEVRANWYDYVGEVLTFHENVRGTLFEGDIPRVTLNCESLAVTFLSNTVQRVVAETNVYAHQLPVTKPGGKVLERELTCNQFQILVRTNGLIEEMDASGNCRAVQTTTTPGAAKPVRSIAIANVAKAFFRPDSNAVDHAFAEQNVVLTRDDRTARGTRLDYTATNDTATLTGDPSFETVSIRLTSQDAIVYDHARGIVNAFARPVATIPLTPEMLSKARAQNASKPAK